MQHKAKLSAVFGSRCTPKCYFFILYEPGGASTGLKYFWSFVLATFSDSKCYACHQQCARYSVHGAVFSEECCMENIAPLFVFCSSIHML